MLFEARYKGAVRKGCFGIVQYKLSNRIYVLMFFVFKCKYITMHRYKQLFVLAARIFISSIT